MKRKVIKKFYDPFQKKRIYPGEIVEIAEEYLEGYRPYVEVIETATLRVEPEERVIRKSKKRKGDD